MTDSERLILISTVYNAVVNNTETFHGRVGGDLAYLLGAIAESPIPEVPCAFSERSGIVQILRRNFAHDHKVWSFIKLNNKE